MALKGLRFDSNSREGVLSRALELVGAVRVALSPKSSRRPVKAEWLAPVACNDVATFSGDVELDFAEDTKVSEGCVRRHALRR